MHVPMYSYISSYPQYRNVLYVCTDFYSDSQQLPLSKTKKAKTRDDTINGKTKNAIVYVIIKYLLLCMC